MKPWKFIPVISDPDDLQYAIHADVMTRPLDVVGRPYKRTVEYEGRTMYVMRLGTRKTVIVTGSRIASLMCVPAERATLSRGFKTRRKAAAGNPTPFSVDARNVIMNGPPQADYSVASLAGAGLFEYTTADAPPLAGTPDIYGVQPGLYNSVKHPGDVSWGSADGLTVVSWWAGGRYATSAQLWYGTTSGSISGMPTWTDLDALADGGSQSAVLDGTLPLAQSAISHATAIETYAQGRSYNTDAVRYGVWKNGALWYKNKPGIAHMHRKRMMTNPDTGVAALYNELISVVGYLAGTGAVRLWLRFTPDIGDQVEFELQLARLTEAKGEVLNSKSAPGSWHGGQWYENGLVIKEEGLDGTDYQCYAIFNPAGTKLLVYGVTSGPVMLDPGLMDTHTAADYRLGQVFVCDVPTEAIAPARMTHSDDVQPSFTAKVVEPNPPNVTATPADFLLIEQMDELTARIEDPGSGALIGIGRYSRIRCKGIVRPGGITTDFGDTNKIEISATYSELIPFVDWGPDGVTPVAPRKLFTSYWLDQVVDLTETTESIKGYVELSFAGGSSLSGASITYDYYALATYHVATLDPADGVWKDGGGTPVTTTKITTTSVNYTGSGSPTISTSTITGSLIVANTWDPVVLGISSPLVTPGPTAAWSSVTRVTVTFQGSQPLCREESWTSRSSEIGTPFSTAQEVVNTAGGSGFPFSRVTDVHWDNMLGEDNDTIKTTFVLTKWGYSDYQLYVPPGFKTPAPVTPSPYRFFDNRYVLHLIIDDGDPDPDNVTSLDIDVKTTWSDVLYCDPRWSVIHVAAERLWEVYDPYGNTYYPGFANDSMPVFTEGGGVSTPSTLTELTFDSPVEHAIADTQPATQPGFLYVDVPTGVHPGRTKFAFQNLCGPYTADSFEEYIPDVSDSYTFRYRSGVFGAAMTPSGYERLYHYSVSPDVETGDKRLFGLPSWHASWPGSWGSDTDRKPAVWLPDGTKKPIAIEEVYGAGVIYTSPIFIRRYKK